MIDNISLISQSAIKIITNNNKIVYFDPFKIDNIDYADFIFITHPHYDHYSEEDILKIKKESTIIIIPTELEMKVKELGFKNDNIILVNPNEEYTIDTIIFKTIPAYNKKKIFHPKGSNWVGYILNIDNIKVYVAGDTDNIEETQKINCDIACVPIGGTYTMDYKEASELIKVIKPKIAIPTHYKTIVGTVKDAYKFKKILNGIVEVKILMD